MKTFVICSSLHTIGFIEVAEGLSRQMRGKIATIAADEEIALMGPSPMQGFDLIEWRGAQFVVQRDELAADSARIEATGQR